MGGKRVSQSGRGIRLRLLKRRVSTHLGRIQTSRPPGESFQSVFSIPRAQACPLSTQGWLSLVPYSTSSLATSRLPVQSLICPPEHASGFLTSVRLLRLPRLPGLSPPCPLLASSSSFKTSSQVTSNLLCLPQLCAPCPSCTIPRHSSHTEPQGGGPVVPHSGSLQPGRSSAQKKSSRHT